MLSSQNLLGEPLRPRDVALTRIEDRLHEGIAASYHIANHPNIRAELQLLGAKPLGELDSQRTQLIAHRGIHIGVAAGHAVAGSLGDCGDPAHERAANAQDMEMRRHEATRFYD